MASDAMSKGFKGAAGWFSVWPEPLYEKVQSCVVQREFGTSDHGPIVVNFDDPIFDLRV